MTKSSFQREPGRVFGVDQVGNQRAKTEGGHHPGPVREGYLRIAKVVGFCCRFHMREPTPESPGFLPEEKEAAQKVYKTLVAVR